MWITAFPEDGKGYMSVKDLIVVAQVYQYCMMNYVRTRVRAYTVCGDEVRRWHLTNRIKIEALRGFMLNNAYTGRLQIRVKAKKRHH